MSDTTDDSLPPAAQEVAKHHLLQRRDPLVRAKTGQREPPPPPPPQLSVQQEAYCRARALGMDVAEAIRQVGRSVQMAKKWEEMPEVQRRTRELAEIATENAIIKAGIDREYVLTKLKTVVERCTQGVPVLNSHGAHTGEWKFDAAGANTALKLLGQELGMFSEKPPAPEDPLANLSDDDLRRIATHLATQTKLLPAGGDVIDVEASS